MQHHMMNGRKLLDETTFQKKRKGKYAEFFFLILRLEFHARGEELAAKKKKTHMKRE
jgi:hypothetical protein